jgi:hypothetical protein
MDCKKAQRLFDDLPRNRLSEQLSLEVRQHLDDCTDCRVMEQRVARLQRLLALKRHERPAPEYFDNFLNEFHNRLLEEARGRTRLWERVIAGVEDALTVQPGHTWRYGFAGAMASVLAIGAMWMGVRQPDQSSPAAIGPITVGSSPLTFTAAALPAPQSTPKSIAATLPSPTESASVGNVLVVPAAEPAEPSTPRYVLDRIRITPASYEVASVHF